MYMAGGKMDLGGGKMDLGGGKMDLGGGKMYSTSKSSSGKMYGSDSVKSTGKGGKGKLFCVCAIICSEGVSRLHFSRQVIPRRRCRCRISIITWTRAERVSSATWKT